MKIYIGHSSGFDFQEELYRPIRESKLNSEHEIILPHEKSDKQFSSKELFQSGCDLMVAEISFPSTGLGIELGWANAFGCPIICVYRKNSKISGSLKSVCDNFIEYENPSKIPNKISKYLSEHIVL